MSNLPAPNVWQEQPPVRRDLAVPAGPERNPSALPALRALADQLSFVVPKAVLPQLDANNKGDAIGAMVQQLATAGAIPPGQQESITKAVLDREQLASTGIGKGIAIPHARHPAVDRVVAALAFSQVGIDFDSVDGENVHLICLVLSPADRPADHLLALQAVSRHMANTDYAAWRSPHRHRHVAGFLPRQACASLAGFLRRGDI